LAIAVSKKEVGNMYTLMLVEDECNILYGMKNAILCHNALVSDVMTAENGREALNLLEEKIPDMIITDIRMPEIDGIQLVQEIRGRGYQMPIIILTALEDFNIARGLIAYKIQNYIVKPFSIEEILAETEAAVRELDKRSQMKMAQKIVEEFPDLVKTPQDSDNLIISQALTYITEHLCGACSLNDISEALHVSKAYLSTLFKKEMNCTVTDYVTKQRMKEAKKLLIETEMQVSQIYMKVGYQSDKYFIKVFKEYEGMTPLVYRKKWRKNHQSD
jgi:YesN/AraC family two-component response regulator